MYFYEVIVLGSNSPYVGQKYFTYYSSEPCSAGEIVRVPFGKAQTYGVVVKTTKEVSSRAIKKLQSFSNPLILPTGSMDLARWISEFYITPLARVLRMCIPAHLTDATLKTSFAQSSVIDEKPPKKHLALNTTQQNIVRTIDSQPGLHMLHGVTGSGKTHIYVALAQKAIESGGDVLVLIPEIALTTQLVDVFTSYFGSRVQVYHSSLSDKQRRDVWVKSLRSSGGFVWIGTRSSLFLPSKHIKLILMDESHDTSFRQDTQPRYHATTVAARHAELFGTTVVYGSATPSVRDTYVAAVKDVPIHVLSKSVQKRTSEIKLVDMRSNALRGAHSSIPWLSSELQSLIADALERKEQVLLFLNRRGNATQLRCTACGWHMACIRCGLTMVYHEDRSAMLCHGCGLSSSVPLACPTCNAVDLFLRGYGTKEIEKTITVQFPKARILRLDHDSFKPSDFEMHYRAMIDGKVDILIGTQILAKGFDLPHLTTIGIIDADTMLQLPDFSANERTFQLLTQVIGRGSRRGQKRYVVIQTYQPDHPIIQAATKEDYQAFYNYELAQRKLVGLPPFRYVLKLTLAYKTSGKAHKVLLGIASGRAKGIAFLGPAPCFYGDSQTKWQLICLSPKRAILETLVKKLPPPIHSELDPIDLL